MTSIGVVAPCVKVPLESVSFHDEVWDGSGEWYGQHRAPAAKNLE